MYPNLDALIQQDEEGSDPAAAKRGDDAFLNSDPFSMKAMAKDKHMVTVRARYEMQHPKKNPSFLKKLFGGCGGCA